MLEHFVLLRAKSTSSQDLSTRHINYLFHHLNDAKFVVVPKPDTTGEEAVQRLIPKATFEIVDTEMGEARRVLDGTADAFVYDLPFNAVFRAMHPSDQIIFLDKPFTKEPIAWAIRKNDPDSLKWLNSFLKKDGRFEKMHKKWFENTDWFKYVR